MTNEANYVEIGSPDPDAASEFYGTLFGWKIADSDSSAPYRMIDGDRGGLWDTSQQGAQHWAIFYVQVDDVRTALDRAQELGASVQVPFTDNGRIEFAHLADPQGNRFGIWRPKPGS